MGTCLLTRKRVGLMWGGFILKTTYLAGTLFLFSFRFSCFSTCFSTSLLLPNVSEFVSFREISRASFQVSTKFKKVRSRGRSSLAYVNQQAVPEDLAGKGHMKCANVESQ